MLGAAVWLMLSSILYSLRLSNGTGSFPKPLTAEEEREYLARMEQGDRAARDALNGWDPTNGCLYYYNPATATSKWIWSLKVELKIGKHSFAKA